MASIMTEIPGVVNTIDAADLAASVAPATAIPQSAFFNAGASFTPSQSKTCAQGRPLQSHWHFRLVPLIYDLSNFQID